MPHADVNGAQLWIEDDGAGPAVLFVHGGLGDNRLWEPQAHALADEFRTIRYDLRYWGRSTAPPVEFSMIDDAIGVLDAIGVERAAIVGLSLGGGLALDVTLAHPDRIWALAHVAAGVSGMPVAAYSKEQETAYEAAETTHDLETMMGIDLDVWAPLGVDEQIRELWQLTPDALGPPDYELFRSSEPAADRLEQVAVPTLVVVPAHDPPTQREVGATVARRVPGAQLVQIDSDHYLTLRAADRVTDVLREFLRSASAR